MIDKTPFENVNINKDFIGEIFKYDIRKLETTDSLEISQFCIALGQYLIYLKYQMNTTKIFLALV